MHVFVDASQSAVAQSKKCTDLNDDDFTVGAGGGSSRNDIDGHRQAGLRCAHCRDCAINRIKHSAA